MAKNNLSEMIGLDIFLQSLSDTDREKYSKEVVPKSYLSPSKGVGLPSAFFEPENPICPYKKDYDTLLFMASQFYWNSDINKILTNPYDALVVTDSSQKIIWTNPGFYKMTGYSQSYALDKKPSFLQGTETSVKTKHVIKDKLLQGKPFTEKILNYKKNQKEYWCQIHIFPMQNKTGITHFIALETELL